MCCIVCGLAEKEGELVVSVSLGESASLAQLLPAHETEESLKVLVL